MRVRLRVNRPVSFAPGSLPLRFLRRGVDGITWEPQPPREYAPPKSDAERLEKLPGLAHFPERGLALRGAAQLSSRCRQCPGVDVPSRPESSAGRSKPCA